MSSSPTSSHRLDEGETDNPIADARTLEGESGGEEEQHSHAQAPGPESPNLTSASKCEVAAAWWTPLASELLAVFSHWSSLSGSFQTVSVENFHIPPLSKTDYISPRRAPSRLCQSPALTWLSSEHSMICCLDCRRSSEPPSSKGSRVCSDGPAEGSMLLQVEKALAG